MSWTLPDIERKQCERNPLIAVVTQIRFDPILRIASEIAPFQECVRSRFPKYAAVEAQLHEVNTLLGVRVRTEKQHRFSTAEGTETLILETQSVALEYKAYASREGLLKDFVLVCNAMSKCYSPVNPTRIGLRYINNIDRELVSKDLARQVEWSDLVAKAFFSLPANLVTLEDTRYATEVASTIHGGQMTLRYGLLSEEPSKKFIFRLDIDRYQEGAFPMAKAKSILEGFGRDVYTVFAAARATTLLEWMKPLDS